MELNKYNLDILGLQEKILEEQKEDLSNHNLLLTDSWLSTAKASQGGVGIAVTKNLPVAQLSKLLLVSELLIRDELTQ